MWRLFKFITFIALGLIAAVALWIGYEVVTFPNVAKLQNENPPTTALIDMRLREAQANGANSGGPKRVQMWVELERISPHLQRAVLAGEDSNFATHNGFDYAAIQKVWEAAQREAAKEAKEEGEADESGWIPPMPNFKRGASTITQQLAKNLYLSSERSFLRKGREAAITFFLERRLSKRRILEIYLNVIEWGDGVYGAEAAARTYFGKSAASLTAREAAFLSAIIPNPRTVFNPKINPRRVARRQRIIQRGMPHVRLPGK